MRILITGFVAFVIWGVFSAWVYNDKVLPALRTQEPVVTIPESITAAPSAAPAEVMPEKLTIYFDFNKNDFKNDPKTDSCTASFKQWLDKHPETKLSVTGHTCIVGTDEYNQKLGMKRAEEIEKYLEKQGVAQERITVASMGEKEPVADNVTGEGRSKNRRGEVTIKTQ
jgi:outer membrane protein OmpA-like peptidoglycan-associated protein